MFKMSNFKLNKSIAELMGLRISDMQCTSLKVKHDDVLYYASKELPNRSSVNYCQSWGDIMPIAIDMKVNTSSLGNFSNPARELSERVYTHLIIKKNELNKTLLNLNELTPSQVKEFSKNDAMKYKEILSIIFYPNNIDVYAQLLIDSINYSCFLHEVSPPEIIAAEQLECILTLLLNTINNN